MAYHRKPPCVAVCLAPCAHKFKLSLSGVRSFSRSLHAHTYPSARCVATPLCAFLHFFCARAFLLFSGSFLFSSILIYGAPPFDLSAFSFLFVPQTRLFVPQTRLFVPQISLFVPQISLFVPQTKPPNNRQCARPIPAVWRLPTRWRIVVAPLRAAARGLGGPR